MEDVSNASSTGKIHKIVKNIVRNRSFTSLFLESIVALHASHFQVLDEFRSRHETWKPLFDDWIP